MKRLFPILCALAIILTGGCARKTSSPAAKKAPPKRALQNAVPPLMPPPPAPEQPLDPAAPSPQLVTVQTVAAESMNTTGTATVAARVFVAPEKFQDVKAKFGGTVQEILVKEGAYVRAGTPLLVLDSPEFAATQQEYLVSFRAKVTSPSLLQQTYQRLLAAGFTDGEIRSLEKTGSTRKTVPVLAPAAGTVVGTIPTKGSTIKAGEPVLQIADLSHVQVVADVAEEDLHAFSTQPVLKIAIPGKTLTGKLASLAPPAEATSHSGTVRVDVENRDAALLPGMQVDLSAEVGAATVTLIPERAVLVRDRQAMVFVVSAAGTLELREVEIGMRSERGIEIRSGVAAGERVMILENSAVDPAALIPAAEPPPAG